MKNILSALLKIIFASTILLSISRCDSKNTSKQSLLDAHDMFEALKKSYGGDIFLHSIKNFNVYDFKYVLKNSGYKTDFSLTRTVDTTTYTSIYRNGYIQLFINDVLQEDNSFDRRIIDVKLDAFSFLTSVPHSLTGNEYTFSHLKDVVIRNKDYYTLLVRSTPIFDQPLDQYILYINPDTKIIDYMAYYHHISGSFNKFRRYYNHQVIDSIRFADYYEFTNDNDTIPLDQIYKSFNSATLRQLDHIQYSNIQIALLED